MSALLRMDPEQMFRGKMLPDFWERTQDQREALMDLYGIDKFEQVYFWLFRYVERMQFGQYMVVDKIAADIFRRQLLYYCMELIYQSDLLSQFHFARENDELRIYMDHPSQRIIDKCSILLRCNSRGEPVGYILIDQYTRMKEDINDNVNDNANSNVNDNYNDNSNDNDN